MDVCSSRCAGGISEIVYHQIYCAYLVQTSSATTVHILLTILGINYDNIHCSQSKTLPSLNLSNQTKFCGTNHQWVVRAVSRKLDFIPGIQGALYESLQEGEVKVIVLGVVATQHGTKLLGITRQHHLPGNRHTNTQAK